MPSHHAAEEARERIGIGDRSGYPRLSEQGLAWAEHLLRDLVGGVRFACRQKGYATAVVATLALGIAALSTVINLAHQVLVPAQAFAEPGRVRILEYRDKKSDNRMGIYRSQYETLAAQLRNFDAIAAQDPGTTLNLVQNGMPSLMNVIRVTPRFFEISGKQPLLGRWFTQAEFEAGDDSLIILSHYVWTHSFAQDPSIVGRKIEVGGRMRDVIAVLPDGFRCPMDRSGWDMLVPMRETGGKDDHPWDQLHVFGLLKRGVAETQIAAELETVKINAEFAAEYTKNSVVYAVPVLERYLPRSSYVMWVMAGAALFLHAIACTNCMALILVRTRVRRRELAIRLALGASIWRVRRLLLSENLVLCLGALVLGAFLALWASESFVSYVNFWWLGPVRFQPRALLLTALAVGGPTVVLVSVVAIFRAVTRNLSLAINEGAGSIGQTRAARHWLDGAVIIQAALAVTLLAGAGLMLRTLYRLRATGVGFDTTRKIGVRVNLPPRSEDISKFLLKLESTRDEFTRIPGVLRVEIADFVPLSRWYHLGGPVQSIEGAPVNGMFDGISPDFMPAMGIPTVKGTGISALRKGGEPGALINETLARKCFGQSDPLGCLVDVGDTRLWGPDYTRQPPARVRWRVLGVVADVRPFGQRQPPTPQVYYPYWQRPAWDVVAFGLVIQLRYDVDASFEENLRRIAYSLDPEMTITTLRLDAEKEWKLSSERYAFTLLKVLSALALFLAAVGLHSVMAYGVQQRQKEFGLRMALGAEPWQIMRSVLRRGIALALLGVLLGLMSGWFLSSFLEQMLFEVGPHDPTVYGIVACILVAVGSAASLGPAYGALRINPVEALRAE